MPLTPTPATPLDELIERGSLAADLLACSPGVAGWLTATVEQLIDRVASLPQIQGEAEDADARADELDKRVTRLIKTIEQAIHDLQANEPDIRHIVADLWEVL